MENVLELAASGAGVLEFNIAGAGVELLLLDTMLLL